MESVSTCAALEPVTSSAPLGRAFFYPTLLAAPPGCMFMVKLMVQLFPVKRTNILMQSLNVDLSHH